MIAFFLSPIYLLVCWYLLRWILRWMKACHGVFHKKKVQIGLVIGYAFVALSLLTSFLLPVSPLQRVLKHCGLSPPGAQAHQLRPQRTSV